MLTLRRPSRALAGEDVGVVFDRIGGRAWTLAVWIVHDEQIAADVVVEAFTLAQRARAAAVRGDAILLCEVRRLAIAAATATAPADHDNDDGPLGQPSGPPDAPVAAAICALPEPQRVAIELVLLGRLGVAAIAAATTMPSGDVTVRLAEALRVLQPILHRGVPVAVSARAAAPGRPQSPAAARSASARSDG